ncbi:MAG: cytochrome c [Planctomycetes bacterium]|nr:cytochrome c [Planctomycetota bacterium]
MHSSSSSARNPKATGTQLKTFEFSVNELVRNAEDKDLDGATLAFTQMTISCVNCHKELRKK